MLLLSIKLKKQSKLSGLRPDTSSLVFFLSSVKSHAENTASYVRSPIPEVQIACKSPTAINYYWRSAVTQLLNTNRFICTRHWAENEF